MRNRPGKAMVLAAALMITTSMAPAVLAAPASPDAVTALAPIDKEIRKELVTLPWYGVFDNLAFERNGGTVTLYGQVVRPTTRSDAEARVKRIPGVERVVNKIEVLPLSPYDDAIRMRTYRAVFGRNGLSRYAMGANPSIHIIVDRGRVTLEGVVDNKMDSQLAYMAARGVPGVFQVTNNLRVESDGK